MINWDRVRRQIERDEDRRRRPYRCKAGKLTVGVGRNLEGKDLSNAVIDLMFREDLESALQDCMRVFEPWPTLSDSRKEALIEMMFQLGAVSVLGFKDMIAAMERGDHEGVADAMLDSKWHRFDTPLRAKRVAEKYRRG